MDNALDVTAIFAEMVRNKISLAVAKRIRSWSGSDLKDMSVKYHRNAMMELQFTARCKVYGKDKITYVVTGSVDDIGEVTVDCGG